MTNDLGGKQPAGAAGLGASERPLPTNGAYRLLGMLLGGAPLPESVTTQLPVKAPLETVWHMIMFYEEIPGATPLLLRTLIPRPVRSEGGKDKPGSLILCTYASGNLIKRITAVRKPHQIEFEVIDQQLGIERCVVAQTGAYMLRRDGDGTIVELTTNYIAFLRPRWLCRPLEKVVVHQLHRHILNGMRRSLVQRPVGTIAEHAALQVGSQGEEVCTSQSRPLL